MHLKSVYCLNYNGIRIYEQLYCILYIISTCLLSYLASKPVIHCAEYDLTEVYDPRFIQQVFLVHFSPEIIGILRRGDD